MRTLAFLLGKALRRRFRLLLVFGLLAVGLCAAYLELVVLADRNPHPLNHSELLPGMGCVCVNNGVLPLLN